MATIKKNYFIMLNAPGGILCMLDDNDNVHLFETVQEARNAMIGHKAAEAWGYEIFQIGNGEWDEG